jgi:PAS domain S-box-containing protein
VRGGGVVCNLETVRVAKDGRKIPVLLTIAPIKDRAGAVTGMSASVIDITRTKLAEGALEEADRRKE